MKIELQKKLNDHLELEFSAAHEYLGLAIWFDLKGLPGFASFMRSQSSDETAHALRFVEHLLGRDLEVELPGIGKPNMRYQSAREAVQVVLEREQRVTASIHALYTCAQESGDRAAALLLDWFVLEQVEEESVARALLTRLDLAGDSSVGLLMVDQELQRGNVPRATASHAGT